MQLDPGYSVWRQITLTLDDGNQLATVYVFNQALGAFVTGREYWYVNQGAVGEIGR
jgi:hypothetical protein